MPSRRAAAENAALTAACAAARQVASPDGTQVERDRGIVDFLVAFFGRRWEDVAPRVLSPGSPIRRHREGRGPAGEGPGPATGRE